jgi:hypothetical protein
MGYRGRDEKILRDRDDAIAILERAREVCSQPITTDIRKYVNAEAVECAAECLIWIDDMEGHIWRAASVAYQDSEN